MNNTHSKHNDESGGLGTILPTYMSKRINEKVYRADQRRKEEVGKAQLGHYDRRSEQGEVRYYDGANRYAVVNSMGHILWFEKRGDEWYSASAIGRAAS